MLWSLTVMYAHTHTHTHNPTHPPTHTPTHTHRVTTLTTVTSGPFVNSLGQLDLTRAVPNDSDIYRCTGTDVVGNSGFQLFNVEVITVVDSELWQSIYNFVYIFHLKTGSQYTMCEWVNAADRNRTRVYFLCTLASLNSMHCTLV